LTASLELASSNPWWKERGLIETDPLLVALEEASVSWVPPILEDFTLDQDAVYTLRGPRQVGKTTACKLLVKRLLDAGIEPRAVVYFSCDRAESAPRLRRMIEQYTQSLRQYYLGRIYLILDEISFIDDWQTRVIKVLYDSGLLHSVTAILTGSHAHDIRMSAEQLPGRRGRVKDPLDKNLLPMAFREYAKAVNPELASKLKKLGLYSAKVRSSLIEELLEGAIPEPVHQLGAYVDVLQALLDQYLLTGGMPFVVDEYVRNHRIGEATYRTYLDVVLNDISRLGRRREYARQVLQALVNHLGSRLSWRNICEETDIPRHETAADYVNILKDSYILLLLHAYDASRDAADSRKNKKVCFRDPFFLHAVQGWLTVGEPFESSQTYLATPSQRAAVVEQVVIEHLGRYAVEASIQKQLFDIEYNLFYWIGKEGNEVDGLVKLPEGIIPVEVKYQSEVTSDDLNSIYAFFKTGRANRAIVATKEELDLRRSLTLVPTRILLTLL